MWRENTHTHSRHFSAEQTEAQSQCPRHWSVVEQENENIGFRRYVGSNLQQSNVHQHAANSTYYGRETGQYAQIPPPSIFALNVDSRFPDQGYFSSAVNIKGMKRKGNGDYSPYHPVWKQHITDERMAAGMNNLYINNDHNYCNTSIFNTDDNLNMEFDDLPTSNKRLDVSCGVEENFENPRIDYPVFQFCAPLKQFLKQKNEILPAKIMDEIYKPCLAVVPWTPPLNTEGNTLEEPLEEEEEEEKVDAKGSSTNKMEDENDATLSR